MLSPEFLGCWRSVGCVNGQGGKVEALTGEQRLHLVRGGLNQAVRPTPTKETPVVGSGLNPLSFFASQALGSWRWKIG